MHMWIFLWTLIWLFYYLFHLSCHFLCHVIASHWLLFLYMWGYTPVVSDFWSPDKDRGVEICWLFLIMQPWWGFVIVFLLHLIHSLWVHGSSSCFWYYLKCTKLYFIMEIFWTPFYGKCKNVFFLTLKVKFKLLEYCKREKFKKCERGLFEWRN